MKAIILLPIAHNFPYRPKKKKTTHTHVLVKSVEYFFFSTLKELTKYSKDIVQQEVLPPIHETYEEDIVIFHGEQLRVYF